MHPADHVCAQNWPKWYKYYVLTLLCLLAFCVQCERHLPFSYGCKMLTAALVGAGMVPAAFGVIAKDFGVTHQQASYLTTSYTLLGGVTPLLLTPYVNLYGRRPAYLVRSLQDSRRAYSCG